MASIYVTEYSALAMDINGHPVAAGHEPAIAEQKDDVDGTSDSLAAFNDGTRFVLIHVDAITHIKFGKTPTAAVTTARMPADSSRFFGVNPGDTVAYITGS